MVEQGVNIGLSWCVFRPCMAEMLKALQVQKTGDNKWIEVEEENRKHFEWDGLMMAWLLDLPYIYHTQSTKHSLQLTM